MIDLSTALPNTITVGGKAYLVKTDFREWLKFSKIIENQNVILADVLFLFEDEIPQLDFSQELVDFFTNPNSTPNYTSGANERILDYLEDGEFIYASFMADYGIDLCDPNLNLHWHQFKALLIGLTDESRLKQIMAMRSYNPSDAKKKPEDIAKQNKRAWALPNNKNKEMLKEIQEIFG